MDDSLHVATDFIVLAADWTIAHAQLILAHTACQHVIVRRNDGDYLYWFPLAYAKRQFDNFPNDATVMDALNLHEYTATPTILRGDVPPSVSHPTIVLEPNRSLAGIVRPNKRGTEDYGKGKGIDEGTTTFTAYPAVLAPAQVAVNQSFTLAVGFRDTPDATLIGGNQSFHVVGLQQDEQCSLILSGDGIHLDHDIAEIPFSLHETALFQATPTRTGLCQVHVDYYRQRLLIGRATRTIVVDDTNPNETEPSAPLDLNPNPPDLLLTLRRNGDVLLWIAVPADPQWERVINAPSPRPLAEAAAQALALEIIQAGLEQPSVATRNTLDGFGSDIADLVPADIWQLQHAMATAYQRPLTVLLKTDEVFIPWELALLEHALPCSSTPLLIWAAQTSFARWIDHHQAAPIPPVTATITTLSVVASEYGVGTNLNPLKYAIQEQTWLVEHYQATPYEATMTALEPLLTAPRTNDHWVHFAVHGRSEPQAHMQKLMLADKSSLSPRGLIGNPKERPARLSVLVLNACQVATPGMSFGQIAGFPVEILRGGGSGFLAPLWEADDAEAFQFAQTLYDAVFTQRQSIGTLLQAYRATYANHTSTTPFAYIYYGHPALQIAYQQ